MNNFLLKNTFKFICMVVLPIALAILLVSCKGGKNSSKSGADSLSIGKATNADSTAAKDSSQKEVALKYEDQENILSATFIPGGETDLGSFDLENVNMEDFNPLDIDANNIKRKVSVKSFYMDETEIANIHWLEYLFVLQRDSSKDVYESALPDTTVWSKDMAYNDFYVENYLRYPGFRFFPVVGINWMQANDYCLFRTAMVNEYLAKNGGIEAFIKKKEEPKKKSKKSDSKAIKLTDSTATTATSTDTPVDTSSNTAPGAGGPVFRLPTEEEWEYAAQAFVDNQFKDENETHQRIYPWDGNTMRNSNKKQLGNFLANFKRGRGDYGGISKSRRTDGAIITNYIWEYPPNDFGLYNMAGNVNEWVYDEYIPLSFTGIADEQEEQDSGFLEGSSSQDYNKAGFQIFSDGKIRIYKGGSWNDVAYWLSPGTRRFLAQDSSTSTIGFRCAMDIGGQKDNSKTKNISSNE